MFVFYYAVLSEVSPPTALSPFAAAAITGGNPFRTTMLTWKYTLPAFLVPFAFTWTTGAWGYCCAGPAADVVLTGGRRRFWQWPRCRSGTVGYLRRPATHLERGLADAGRPAAPDLSRRADGGRCGVPGRRAGLALERTMSRPDRIAFNEYRPSPDRGREAPASRPFVDQATLDEQWSVARLHGAS